MIITYKIMLRYETNEGGGRRERKREGQVQVSQVERRGRLISYTSFAFCLRSLEQYKTGWKLAEVLGCLLDWSTRLQRSWKGCHSA